MDESFDPLKCNEDLPSSPGCHMEYGEMLKQQDYIYFLLFFLPAIFSLNLIVIFSSDDMPELQEVEEDQRSQGLFQVGAVSHQELGCSPNTNWLAELANIATSPQSPLLKDVPHKRFR